MTKNTKTDLYGNIKELIEKINVLYVEIKD